MSIHHCAPGINTRQLALIQRIGRIGYWEYARAERTVCIPAASQDLLAAILGGADKASRSLMEALCDIERKRFQSALDRALELELTINIEIEASRADGSPCYLVVRGIPVQSDHGSVQLAGTFQDISNQKQREADHENVITQLQALLDALPQGVSVIDRNLRLILWNKRFHETLGFPQSMVFRNAHFEDFIRLNAQRGEYGPGDPEQHVQLIIARAREFVPHSFERQMTGGRTVLVEGYPFRSGSITSGFITTYTDITDHKRAEEQLTRQRDVMKTVIDNFPGGISLCDADLRFTTYNDQFGELLEFPSALFSKGWVDFEDLVRFNCARGEYGACDTEQEVKAAVARARNFQAHQMERMRPNGRWLEIRGTPIPSGGFVTSYIDITERKQTQEQVRQLAFYDPLTKLPNRRLLNDRLSQAVMTSKRNSCYGALMVLDLDNFKPLNDTHGHLVGDLLLIEAARRLVSCVREVDTVARFGGDEFVVMLSELDADAAVATALAGVIAEKIRCKLSDTYLLSVGSDESTQVTVEHHSSASIGAVVFLGNQASPEGILKCADAAMYLAKEDGRNAIRFHEL
jgi:diguanylate cyclase (GGDEF)-like protein/PAS domain S-box-containing protein